MKKLFWILLISPLTSFTQSSFTIKGRVNELEDGNKLYFFYRLNDSFHKDSTIAKNKSFVFNGYINGHCLGFISARENPFSNIQELHDEIHLYVEPGHIFINGKDSLKYATVSGTLANKNYSELEKELTPYYGDLNQMAPVKLAFINKHKNSYISLETLIGMLNQADVNAIDSAYNGLSASLKNSFDGKIFAKKLSAAKKSRIGTTATNFKLPNAKNKLVSLTEYRGRYVLVDFWASWCTPCRQENPNVIAAYEHFKSKNFTVLSVSIDDQNSKAAWIRAITKYALPWTQLLDANKKVYILYGVTYIPANFLLNPEGRIIATNLKGNALMNKLSEVFKENN